MTLSFGRFTKCPRGRAKDDKKNDGTAEKGDDTDNSGSRSPIMKLSSVGIPTWLVAIFTGVLAVVGLLQWSTLRSTNETQRASIRAFVHVEKFERAKFLTKDKRRFAVTAFIKNTGKTPAPFVQTRFDCLSPSQNKAAVKQSYISWFAGPLKDADKDPVIVAPEQVLAVQACEFKPQQVDQSRKGESATIVVSEIRYADVFDRNTLTLIRMVQRLNFDDTYDPTRKGGYSFSYIYICFSSECPGYEAIKRHQPN